MRIEIREKAAIYTELEEEFTYQLENFPRQIQSGSLHRDIANRRHAALLDAMSHLNDTPAKFGSDTMDIIVELERIATDRGRRYSTSDMTLSTASAKIRRVRRAAAWFRAQLQPTTQQAGKPAAEQQKLL